MLLDGVFIIRGCGGLLLGEGSGTKLFKHVVAIRFVVSTIVATSQGRCDGNCPFNGSSGLLACLLSLPWLTRWPLAF